jgi:O-antigen/teichoic acid export membrane protein
VLDQPGLILPALTCFLMWQLQEGLRRGMLSGFRYQAASLGDAISYLGQVAVLVGLGLQDMLTLETALYGMAGTSALAAVIQWLQLAPPLGQRLRLRETAADYWSIGGGWSLGNALLLHLRAQLLLFWLAASSGAAAVASFQAALNVVNVSNPIMLALCNILPQAASQAGVNGLDRAWQAARGYMLLAVPAILTFAVILVAVPGQVLALLYGSGSAYVELSLAVRLLTVAACIGYAADALISFLHGIRAVRIAFFVTASGAVATLVLAVPLIGTFGVTGNCLTHVGANVVRLAAARQALARLLWRPVQPEPTATTA